MNRKPNFSGIPPGNPLLNGLMIVGGVLAFAALVLFSLVAFVVIASIITLLAAIFGLRLWWHGRKLGRDGNRERRAEASGNIIEGEYRRVPSRRDEAP